MATHVQGYGNVALGPISGVCALDTPTLLDRCRGSREGLGMQGAEDCWVREGGGRGDSVRLTRGVGPMVFLIFFFTVSWLLSAPPAQPPPSGQDGDGSRGRCRVVDTYVQMTCSVGSPSAWENGNG